VSRRNLPTEFQRATLDQHPLDPRDLSAPQAAFGQSSGAGPSTRTLPSLAVRLGLSFLIIGHLWGVIGRPLEFATQGPFGPSPSMTLLRRPVRGYGEFMYLDHGYAFFAPEPGPSHLIRATIVPPGGQRSENGAAQQQGASQKGESPDAPVQDLTKRDVAAQYIATQSGAVQGGAEQGGATPVEGDAGVVRFFPDRVDQWPRLLYHRHFMLAEFLNTVYHPPGEPPLEIRNDAVASRDWRMSRARYEAVRDSIVRCLNKKYPGMGVKVDRIEHRQPGLPEFMRDGVKLDAPQLYLVLEDVSPEPSAAETNAPENFAPENVAPESVPAEAAGEPSEPALNSPLNAPGAANLPNARASGSSDNALSIARWRRISATWEVRS
jgi:hypothetical protein